jgi:hypothetical protein
VIRPELANAAKIFFASMILYVAYCAVEAREEVRRAKSASPRSHGP